MSEWRSKKDAKPDGTVCQLRLRDSLGIFDGLGEYFLHDDGKWYRINPPTVIDDSVIHSWRPWGDD